MRTTLRIALAQVNPTVGDLAGNRDLALENIERATKAGADLVVFPELMVSGYPPEDLLTRPSFIRKTAATVAEIARGVTECAVLIGAPMEAGGRVRNAACVLSGGKLAGVIYKTELPNYGVFDERRYFEPGANGPLLKIGDAFIGITICEDIWVGDALPSHQVKDGANLLVNLSGSPYRVKVSDTRQSIVSGIARKLGAPFVYCNLVGGQDELVFDGRSFIAEEGGGIVVTASAFAEDLLIADIEIAAPKHPLGRKVLELPTAQRDKPPIEVAARKSVLSEDEEIYEALTLGVHDYIEKNGFKDVVIALSGGIDSALTCAIAVDAIGPERVHVVSLPSPYSSEGSVSDARLMAENFGLSMISLPIQEPMNAFDATLEDVFKGREKDIAEENIQARIRGALVMALSNKFGWLVLTTGNKSEIAVGYCTLYGDMAGGFALIKDVFKTRVYSLCRWRNLKAGRDIIPLSIIEKEPSAELSPGQKDTDSLPPYDVLDPILEAYIEHDKNIDEIENLGYSRQLASRVIRMVDASEYKRRQGPIGVKITSKAFGRDRRHPITCKYIDE